MLSLERPLKIAVLCSGRAPGLLHLLNRDPRRGRDYEVVCCISSQDTFAEEVRVERRGIPCLPHPIRWFCSARGVALRDLASREIYDRETVALLKPYNPDLILLDGYLLLLTAPMLDAYGGRIVNVHHSDLLQRTPDGCVRYPGLRAVRDAMEAGEIEIRASAHIVTQRLDDGPVLLRSWAFPVPEVARWAYEHEATDVLKAAAWAQQEWMLRTAWGPIMARTIELAATSIESAGSAIDITRFGHWNVRADGSLEDMGELVIP